MSDSCKECGKAIKNKPGVKPKKFCSPACRNKYFNKENAAILKAAKALKAAKPETDQVVRDVVDMGVGVSEAKNNRIKRIDPMSNKGGVLLKKNFQQLLDDAKNGVLNPDELKAATLSSHQKQLIFRKQAANKNQ